VFENVGWGEVLVLLIAGLFILGPERLPEAAAWLGRAIRQVKEFASGARNQLRQELGPEFDELRKPLEELRGPLQELRGLRNLDPRRAMVSTLFDDQAGLKPNGFAPPPGGAGSLGGHGVDEALAGNGGSTANGALAAAGAAEVAVGATGVPDGPITGPPPTPPRPLSPGERPPIDSDAT
jgi:sec-independent protein translocase protein TatB